MYCWLLVLMLLLASINSHKLYNTDPTGTKAHLHPPLHSFKERSTRTVPAPSQPITLHVNITTVNITWEYTDTIPPTQFIVQMFSQTYNDSKFHNITQLISNKYYVYSGMKFAVYYQFRVLACKEGQLSDPSEDSTLFDNGLTAPPGPPLGLDTFVESSSSLLLIWSGPKPANELTYRYYLYKGSSEDQLQLVDSVQENTQYSFNHLEPNTLYYFSVQADYGGEKSILSPVVHGSVPYSSLPAVSVFPPKPSYTSAEVEWTHPNISLSITNFTVFYTPILPSSPPPPANSSFFSSKKVVGGSATKVTVSGLEQGARYAFLVRYVAENGKESNLSNVEVVTTLSIPAPSRPITLHVNITTVNITWEYTDMIPPTQFIVQMFSQTYNDSNFHNITQLISNNYYVYSGMKYAVYYKFRVLACKEGQLSDPSEDSTLFDNGLTAPPGPPLGLHTFVESSSSLLLIWSGPEPANELKYLYHLYKGSSEDQLQLVDSVQENTQYSFNHLEPNTPYYFSVQADYGGEKSILSPVVHGSVPYSSLPAVSVFPPKPNYTSAEVEWTHPDISLSIARFTVFYTPIIPSLLPPPANTSLFSSNKSVDGSATKATVSGLEQSAKYAFLVQYVAENGKESNLSNVEVVTTLSSLACLSCHQFSSTQLVLSWKVLNMNNVSQRFTITSMPGMRPMTFNSSRSLIVFTMTGLHPWTPYRFNVSLKGKYGSQNSFCPIDDCRTDEDKPAGYPGNLRALSINSSAINVSWSPVPKNQQNGIILCYLVSCPTCPFSQYSTTELYHIIGGLSPSMIYRFVVSVLNRKGFGPDSEQIAVKTMEDKPTGPPLNTTIVHVTKSYVIVSWQPPDAANQNGEIIMYTICYAKKDISNVSASSHLKMKGLVKRSSVTQSINTTLNTVNITDLFPDTTYVVSISAWTSVGQGPPTPPVVFQTDIATNKDYPNCSLNLTTGLTSQSGQCFTVSLRWSLLCTTDNIQIASYNLTFMDSGAASFRDKLDNSSQSSYRISSDLLRSETKYVIFLEAQLVHDQGSVQASASIKTPGCTGVITVVAVVISCVCTVLLALIIVGVALLIYRLGCLRKSRRNSSSRQQMVRHHVVHNDYITLMKQQRGDGLSTNTGSSSNSSPLHLSSTGDLLHENHDSESGEEHDLLVPSLEEPPPPSVPLHSFPPPPLIPLSHSPSPYSWSEEGLVFQTDGYITNDSFSKTNIKKVPYRPVPEGSSLSSVSSESSESH